MASKNSVALARGLLNAAFSGATANVEEGQRIKSSEATEYAILDDDATLLLVDNLTHGEGDDADEEIVNAAGCSIADIFEIYGEQAFREVEERVMARILSETPSVVATGGGAFINDQTRDLIARHSISVWLKADLKILLERTKRRDSRPILKAGDPQKILRELMETRYPIYAEADLTVETGEESVSDTLQGIMAALETLMPTDGAKPNEV